MRLLAIETSTENASVALLVDGKITAQEHQGAQSHAQFMLPSIDLLLTEARVTLAELDGIVFGCGPGSFTGLRVACSLAKGLAYAHNLSLYPVSTLASIRETVRCDHAKADYIADGILTMIDARMNQIYWSYSTSVAHDVQDESLNFAKDVVVPGTALFCLAGVGWERYEREFSSSMTQRMVECVTVYPNAVAMMRLVEQGLVNPVHASDAIPVYIRDQVTS